VTRNEMLQWHVLGFGLSAVDQDLGRPTNLTELWTSAREKCFACDRDELLDALYTLPREEAALIRFVSTGEGLHPVSFARVRNTQNWPDYFTDAPFNVKVLPEGKAHYHRLSREVEGRAVRPRCA
jgi:hypothetical protein